MPKHHPFICRNKVAAIFEALCGCGASGLKREHFRCNELAIEAVSDGVSTERGDHEPECVDLFVAMQRHAAERERTKNRYPNPKEEPTHECSAGGGPAMDCYCCWFAMKNATSLSPGNCLGLGSGGGRFSAALAVPILRGDDRILPLLPAPLPNRLDLHGRNVEVR